MSEGPPAPRRPPSPLTRLKRRAGRIVRALARLYPDARCALDYGNPLQLLIATILSAQCTDRRVNLVTPALFARYPDATAFAAADLPELERLIQSTGFFRNKARNIVACCREIVARHRGQVPGTMDDLIPLAGIGRKTANVILGNAFNVPGLPVDTHVGRLSRRLALTVHTDPVKVERDLTAVLPAEQWTMFGHRLIYHGRQVCHARKPACSTCSLATLCPKIGVEKPKPAERRHPAAHSSPALKASDATTPRNSIHAQRAIVRRRAKK